MPMSRLGGTHVESAKLCFRFIRLQDLWLGVTATYSSLAYANVPTASPLDGERTFALLMPNKPRLLDVGGKRYWQKPGECVLTDSQASVVGTYTDPHAAICLNIPFDTVRAWLPDTHAFAELRLGSAGTSSRVISLLLLALWRSVEAGGDDSDYRHAAESLLGLLETRCRRSVASGRAAGAHRGIDCELVRNFIDEHIRDPRLSVQTVAEKILATLAAPFEVGGESLRISCSVGVAIFPQDGEDTHVLLHSADLAMYRAKAAGRNRCHFYAHDDQ